MASGGAADNLTLPVVLETPREIMREFGGFARTASYAEAISSGKIKLLSKGGFEVVDTIA